jgi:mono/diheme cytochrome c family protein
MNRRFRLLIGLLFAALSVSSAAAQDVEAGHQIAQRWCSACHEIGTAPVKNDVSPSFWSIARMSSTTAMSLHAFLSTPHHRMPDYSLSRQEIADISAYILSLKTARLDSSVN